MASVRFLREHTYAFENDPRGRRKTWPQYWTGEVADDLAHKFVADGAAEWIGDPPPGGAPAKPEIPADWQALNAADMIALAHKLGAGGEVSTKSGAEEFISALADGKPLI